MSHHCASCTRLGRTPSESTAHHRTEQAWGHVLGVGVAALILSAALFVVLGGVR